MHDGIHLRANRLATGSRILEICVMNTQSTSGLVATAMYSALAAQDVQTAKAFQELYPAPCAEQTVEQQIRHANCFWRQQLGLSGTNTTWVRECLIDQCDLHDWLRWFSSVVAPAIVSLGLPKAQHALHAAVA